MARSASAPHPWPRDAHDKPKRRVSVGGKDNRSIYWRPDGHFEIGYRDSTGRQRWELIAGGIMAARGRRDEISTAKRNRERVQPNPRLKFGDAADKWLADQVADLRPATQASYESYVRNHLKPRWGNRRMDSIDVGDAARLVRDLRALGLAEWTISGILRAAGRIFKFARRHCQWHGVNPFTELESGERPKISKTPERRIYEGDELAQMVAASGEPWRTLFRLASIVGGRESELLGLWWSDLDLDDLDAATIRFGHQVDRKGRRVALKTEESKATLPLPRSTAVMLLEHRARSLHTGPRAFVFATRTGSPLGQRNVLRALYAAQELARDAESQPTFPELFEQDEHGHLVVDERGRFVLRQVKRRDQRGRSALPHFHSLRHQAAMACEDVEEARDLLRHKNSTVTAQVYRGHFTDERRERLRARMEARAEAADGSGPQKAPDGQTAEVVDLQRVRHGAQ